MEGGRGLSSALRSNVSWVCPNDRELALLSKLNTGWTTNTSLDKSSYYSNEENEHIKEVIKKAEQVDVQEQHRVGRLVDRYESMRERAVGDGESTCLLCNDRFRVLGPAQKTCVDCGKAVCTKCCVEMNTKMMLCKICSENRELWKKSGAWFFKGIPRHTPRDQLQPTKSSNTTNNVPVHKQTKKIEVEQYRTWRQAKIHSSSSEESDGENEASFIRLGRQSDLANGSPTNSATESGREDHVDHQEAQAVDQTSTSTIPTNTESPVQPSASNSLPDFVQENTGSELGTLDFSIFYNPNNAELVIEFEKAENLPPMDANGFSDPYVKVYLLPGSSSAYKRRTETVHRTLNPVWDEKVAFHGISDEDIRYRMLRLCVVDEDPIGYDFIGEYRLKLSQVQQGLRMRYHVGLLPTAPLDNNDDLFAHERGRIQLSLRYDPAQAALIVGVIRCTFLLPMDRNGKSDPYVKLYLRPDKEKKTKAKTKVKRKTLDPIFNEEFTFSLKSDEISKKALEVTVWDKDTGSKDDYIGCLVLGKCARGERLRHWLSAFKQIGRTHKQWHHLNGEEPEKLLQL